MSLADSLARLRALLPALDALVLPSPPVLDRSAALASPPLPVGPSAVPGLVKLRAAVVKEVAFCDKLLAARTLAPGGSSAPAPASLEGSTSTAAAADAAPSPEPATNASHLLALFASLAAAPAPLTGVNQTFALPPLARRQPPSEAEAQQPATGAAKASKAAGRAHGNPAKAREIKVNVVCAGGQRWVKVLSGLTVSKLGFELGEDESYDSDSSDASCRSSRSSSSSLCALQQSPAFDRSHARTTLHKTAHALLAAQAVLPRALAPPETVEIQLPRFTADALGRLPKEHRRRVDAVLDEVRGLPGVEVVLALDGGGGDTAGLVSPLSLSPPPPVVYRPTRNVVLDLSLLIALLSGISHMGLPQPSAGPEGVFLPLVRQYNKDGSIRTPEERRAAMLGGSDNVRALTIQLGVEMAHPLVDELVAGLARAAGGGQAGEAVVCWATAESKHRLATIVDKLASPDELRRARSLWAVDGESAADRERRTTAWWTGSRHADGGLSALHRALVDVRSLPDSLPADPLELATSGRTAGGRAWEAAADEHAFGELHLLLTHLLNPPHPQPPANGVSLAPAAAVNASAKLSPSLTSHTLRTLCAAVSRKWTVVTTNRASLCRLWKWWAEAGADPSLGTAAAAEAAAGEEQTAVAWVLEPRSLAESMRA